MQINLIAIGSKMPKWVEDGYQEYAKRLPADWRLNLIEIPAQKRGKNADMVRITEKEGERMLAAIPVNSRVVTLSIKAKAYTTEQLAGQLQTWREDGRSISLLIGGPEGLAPACIAKAENHWSLSPLTLPHPLVRVIVAEQIYRAYTIVSQHPYHRG